MMQKLPAMLSRLLADDYWGHPFKAHHLAVTGLLIVSHPGIRNT